MAILKTTAPPPLEKRETVFKPTEDTDTHAVATALDPPPKAFPVLPPATPPPHALRPTIVIEVAPVSATFPHTAPLTATESKVTVLVTVETRPDSPRGTETRTDLPPPTTPPAPLQLTEESAAHRVEVPAVRSIVAATDHEQGAPVPDPTSVTLCDPVVRMLVVDLIPIPREERGPSKVRALERELMRFPNVQLRVWAILVDPAPDLHLTLLSETHRATLETVAPMDELAVPPSQEDPRSPPRRVTNVLPVVATFRRTTELKKSRSMVMLLVKVQSRFWPITEEQWPICREVEAVSFTTTLLSDTHNDAETADPPNMERTVESDTPAAALTNVRLVAPVAGQLTTILPLTNKSSTVCDNDSDLLRCQASADNASERPLVTRDAECLPLTELSETQFEAAKAVPRSLPSAVASAGLKSRPTIVVDVLPVTGKFEDVNCETTRPSCDQAKLIDDC